MLMHSQSLMSVHKYMVINAGNLISKYVAFMLCLPCHLDEVSLQTHGHSLFLKEPTMHQVCSMETQEDLKHYCYSHLT